jgi:hypothetical protein
MFRFQEQAGEMYCSRCRVQDEEIPVVGSMVRKPDRQLLVG